MSSESDSSQSSISSGYFDDGFERGVRARADQGFTLEGAPPSHVEVDNGGVERQTLGSGGIGDADVQQLILENLGDTHVIDNGSSARDFCDLFVVKEEYKTLHVTVPLLSKEVYNETRVARDSHIHIPSTRSLHRFASLYLGTATMGRITRLEIVVDTEGELYFVAAVLSELPSLETFAIRELVRRLPPLGMYMGSGVRSLPTAVVQALGSLANLRVLVLLPDSTAVSRGDVAAIGRGCRRLAYLHIPSMIVRDMSADLDGSRPPLQLPVLRTLSIGFAGTRRPTNAVREILQDADLPALRRLNVMGIVWESLNDLVHRASLGQSRAVGVCDQQREVVGGNEGVQRSRQHTPPGRGSGAPPRRLLDRCTESSSSCRECDSRRRYLDGTTRCHGISPPQLSVCVAPVEKGELELEGSRRRGSEGDGEYDWIVEGVRRHVLESRYDAPLPGSPVILSIVRRSGHDYGH